MHAMYDALAAWWPLVSTLEDYREEATIYAQLLAGAREVLELGAGGGNNAYHLKQQFALTLVEPAPGMRACSERINPECAHVAGDMRTVRLGRTFDAVFVHDAIAYMTTEDDLRAALATVRVHLEPDGVAVIAHDGVAETFAPATDHGGEDDPAGRSLRYLSWELPPALGATVHEVHYSFLLREADGSVRSVHDVHRCGLFPRATWWRCLAAAGLAADIVMRRLDGVDYETFVCRPLASAPAT